MAQRSFIVLGRNPAGKMTLRITDGVGRYVAAYTPTFPLPRD